MKTVINILFSIFFAIAITVHIYYVMESDGKPLWWHGIYYITYGTCWWMIFSKNKHRKLIYGCMAIFPFTSHVYYGYRHFPAMDTMFWICIVVCIMLIAGLYWIQYSSNSNKE